MMMTENEIVRNFMQSDAKGKQIGILADLNDCNPSEIGAVLEKHGIDISKIKIRAPKAPKTSKPKLEKPRKKRGRPPKSTKATKPSKNAAVDEEKAYLNAILDEGIQAIDERIKFYEDKIAKLERKRNALIELKGD